MFNAITSWCNRNQVLCAIIVLVILFQSGLLGELLRCIGLNLCSLSIWCRFGFYESIKGWWCKYANGSRFTIGTQ